MSKPNESGALILIGIMLFIASFLVNHLDNDTPIYFLLLLSCSGALLATLPIASRFFIVRGLLGDGQDEAAVRERWEINIGFTSF